MATHADTTPAPAAKLAELVAEHRKMMAAFEAGYDRDDDDARAVQDTLYPKLLASRQAILNRRPQSLEEVSMKAGFMMQDRAFVDWDAGGGVEVSDIIASLIPIGMGAEAIADAA